MVLCFCANSARGLRITVCCQGHSMWNISLLVLQFQTPDFFLFRISETPLFWFLLISLIPTIDYWLSFLERFPATRHVLLSIISNVSLTMQLTHSVIWCVTHAHVDHISISFCLLLSSAFYCAVHMNVFDSSVFALLRLLSMQALLSS